MVKSPGPAVPPKSNFDLLLEHLPKDGLAATLVTAHVNRGATSSVDAMRQVLKEPTCHTESLPWSVRINSRGLSSNGTEKLRSGLSLCKEATSVCHLQKWLHKWRLLQVTIAT